MGVRAGNRLPENGDQLGVADVRRHSIDRLPVVDVRGCRLTDRMLTGRFGESQPVPIETLLVVPVEEVEFLARRHEEIRMGREVPSKRTGSRTSTHGRFPLDKVHPWQGPVDRTAKVGDASRSGTRYLDLRGVTWLVA